MAEFVVSGLLKQMASLAAQELELESRLVLFGAQEVRELESKLRIIQSILLDAERRQISDVAVKLWLDRLMVIAYELDDVLDEWNTAMVKVQIEKEQAGIPNPDLKKVFFFPCCFGLFDRLKIRHDIAHKMKSLNGILDEIAREGEIYGFMMTKGTNEIQCPKTNFIKVSDIFGRDRHRDDLMRELLGYSSQEESSPYVISIIGIGGIGKTTLAQLAYNDDVVKDHFELKLWVCVSEAFDLCRIAKHMIECVENRSPNIAKLPSLLDKLCHLIKGRKFLVVLDDLWTEDPTQWEPLRLAFKYGAQGSRIVVTTRDSRVAKMTGSASMIHLELISSEDCWMLFRKIAFVQRDLEQLKKLEDLGLQLVSKCRGLPLAVKILGGLMRLKNSRTEWREVLESRLWEIEDLETGLSPPLLLSYNELPSAMKLCFSYCSCFPKDYVFERDELVRMWMAQGYLDSKANMDMEIIGEEYFENLAVRYFFNYYEADVGDNRITHYKMHGIVHDFSQFLMKKESFTIFADGDKGLGTEFLSKSTRHLFLRLENQAKFPAPVYRAENLRTLLTFGTGCSNNVLPNYAPPNLFPHFRCLRALNLSFTSIQELPCDVEMLIHLRYLNLSHNYHMKRLPKTVCNLCNLQSLVLTMCHRLEKLPQGMGKLINLRHLILGNAHLITSFPRGIGRLSSLRRLDYFFVGSDDDSKGCKLGELKILNYLRGDLTIKGLENVVDVREAENAQLEMKIHLRSLCLEFRTDDEGNRRMENDILVLNALKPNKLLETLQICGYQGTKVFSNWMMSIIRLKTLVLSGFSKLELFPPLGKLPFLESLRIHHADNVRKLGVEFLGIDSKNKTDGEMVLFPNLRSLRYMEMIEWEEWDGGEGEDNVINIMPRLQNLQIEYCPKLKALPDFLRNTPIQELTFIGTPILSERCQITGEDWPKISHIPKIVIDSQDMDAHLRKADGRTPGCHGYEFLQQSMPSEMDAHLRKAHGRTPFSLHSGR